MNPPDYSGARVGHALEPTASNVCAPLRRTWLALALGAAVGCALIVTQRPFGDMLVILSVVPVLAASRLVGAPSGLWVGLLLSLLDTLALGVGDLTPLRLIVLAPVVLALPLIGLLTDALQAAAVRAERLAGAANHRCQSLALEVDAHVQREQYLQGRVTEQSALWDLAIPATAGADLSAFLTLVVQAVVRVLGTDHAAVWVLVPGESVRQLIESGATVELSAMHDGLEPQLVRTVVTGEPVLVDDFRTDLRFRGAPSLDHGFTSGVSVPIFAPAREQAVLSTHTRTPRSFSAFDVVFLEGVARIVASVLERRRTEQTLQHVALHDRLTGLANRALFHERLQAAVGDAKRQHTGMALLVMDLDRFKEVNDTLGHHWGDLLLERISKRLQEIVASTDTVARLGGDEFAIILPSADNVETATRVVQELVNAIVAPVTLEAGTVAVGASIGLVIYPQHGEEADVLLRRADVAMYVAKRGNVDYSVYSGELDGYTTERLERVAELREAIDRDTLVLHYQPLVRVRDRAVVGYEALVRWPHPRHGLLGADEFVPLAEEMGLIKPLDRWVLNAAIRQCRAWADVGQEVPIAVNLSMRNILDLSLPDTVAELLETWHVPSTLLHLEITEGTIMADPPKAMEVLARLRAMRVEISLDDFGTGYSSMEYLKRLPMDSLKIDRSFVLDMASDKRDLAIVRSVIELGHNIGLRVIAEGVENLTTLRLLGQLGCDEAQGQYVGPSLAPLALLDWLAADGPAPAELFDAA